MRILLTISVFVLTIFYAHSQKQAILDVNSGLYLKATAGNATIYSGREEPKYKFKTKNHPYLHTEEFREGTLSVNGTVYPGVFLRLNHDIEELAVLSPDGIFSVLIPREQIDYAIIDSLYIVYRKPKSTDGIVLPEGYYVRMYNGNSQVWKRNVSFINNKITDLVIDYFFDSVTKKYICIDGVYFLVNKKRSVLKLYASKKKEIKKMFKQTGMKYNEDREKAIVIMSRYYDELNK